MQSAIFSHALVVCDLLLFAGCSYILCARTAEGDCSYSCLQDVCVDHKVVWTLSVAGTFKIKKIKRKKKSYKTAPILSPTICTCLHLHLTCILLQQWLFAPCPCASGCPPLVPFLHQHHLAWLVWWCPQSTKMSAPEITNNDYTNIWLVSNKKLTAMYNKWLL
jgi:hypothetical protein